MARLPPVGGRSGRRPIPYWHGDHLELVFDPSEADRDRGSGLSHLVIQVESMDATITDLRTKGIEVAEPGSPDGSADVLTSWITDPDGNRIELVP